MAKLRQNLATKTIISGALASKLRILQANILDMEKIFEEISLENPCLEMTPGGREQILKNRKNPQKSLKNSMSEIIEARTMSEQSLHEFLNEQIAPPLFPTAKSQKIAQNIIENISDEGYFEGNVQDLAQKINESPADYEKIRARFCYVDPPGVGARDASEALRFHLDFVAQDENFPDEMYEICAQILKNLQNHAQFKKNKNYHTAMKIIRAFQVPPALHFAPKELEKIPDLHIFEDENAIKVAINDDFYPEISVQKPQILNAGKEDQKYLATKLKEARDLIDALALRKQTLYKIGLMIVEFQYDFFKGGEISPLRLKDIAHEFGHNESTISRAIADKFLACGRGIFPIKSFFSGAVETTSNAAIKDFVLDLIKNENKKRPLSDLRILDQIREKFGIKMVRRTVTKYRQNLAIESSSQRKKNYALGC